MAGVVRNYRFGVKGVDLVTDSLKLGNEPNDRATQLQNAEIVPDVGRGGTEVISKRGGFATLNGSAMSGSVIGILGWPLKTTFTRTLFAARDTKTANTFKTSTDGVAWTNTSTPAAPISDAKFTDESDLRDSRRMVTFRNLIIYPANGYTKGTDYPIIVYYDGTGSVTIVNASFGPAATVPAVVTDMIAANGVIYFSILITGTAAPNSEGVVLRLDLDTGEVQSIANFFGPSVDGKQPGGHPSCMAWYKGQLYVGQNMNATTDAIGTISRCYPEIDSLWTTDVSNLSGAPCTMRAFQGNLYVGTMSSVSTAEKIYKRSATAGTYSAVFTGVGAGASAHIAHMIEYSDSLYAAQYHATAPTIHIKSSTDGTTWVTDRDVDSSDGAVLGNLPGGSCLGANSDLFYVFRATGVGNTDGFIMRKASGAWTKVDTDNYVGPISMLVQRS